jgi:type I restriction enzyme S subunit
MKTSHESITPEQESVLGSVPKEWKVVQLEDLGHWGGGKTPRKSNQEYWNGETLWVSPKDMDGSVVQRTEDHVTEVALSEKNLTVYDPGSVMVVFRSGVLRHTFPVATCHRPFTVNQDMKVLTPGDRVNNAFAFHLIDHLGPVVLQKATKVGTTVESVDTDSFMSLSIGLPPLSEQRRIADVLDTVDAAIQETDRVVEKQEQVKTGLLQDLLTRGLDAEGRLRDPEREPEAFRETGVAGIMPKDWTVDRIGNLGAWGGGGTPRKSKREFWEGQIPWISPKDMGRPIIDRTEDYITSQAVTEHNLTVYTPGSVAVVFRSGILRHTFPVSTSTRPFTVNQDMKVLTTKKEVADRFALYLLRFLGPLVLQKATKVGTTVDSIDTDSFMELRIGLPSYAEQQQIVRRINTVLDSIEELRSGITKLQHLKTGLMQDLLTGEVRVPEAEARVDEVVA